MEFIALDAAGHRRSPATMPGYHQGRAPQAQALLRPSQLCAWLVRRALLCVIHGPTSGRHWEASVARKQPKHAAAEAGVRRRFAPHQLRHAHAIEMAHERIPPVVIQRQLGHANLGITSIYLQGIDSSEIIDTVHARPVPTISAPAGLSQLGPIRPPAWPTPTGGHTLGWRQAGPRLLEHPGPASVLLRVHGRRAGDRKRGQVLAGRGRRARCRLQKHLLIADSVYVRDSFYYCFARIESCVKTQNWRDNSTLAGQVSYAIGRLKSWLPLLKQLRPLIDTQALVFMPYYMTPSWPYDIGDTPAFKAAFANLRLRPSADPPQAPPRPPIDFKTFGSDPPRCRGADQTGRPQQRSAWFNEREVSGAWLNSRLMGLDAVFPNRPMFDFASRLYLATEDGPGELTCDLSSLDIVPSGGAKPVSIKTLVSLRQNEEGFSAVRSAVVECQAMLRKTLQEGAPRSAASTLCKELFDTRIGEFVGKKGKVLSFVERPIPNLVFTAAVTGALIPTAAINPLIPALGGVALTPALARIIQQRFSHELRAMTSLKALF